MKRRMFKAVYIKKSAIDINSGWGCDGELSISCAMCRRDPYASPTLMHLLAAYNKLLNNFL